MTVTQWNDEVSWNRFVDTRPDAAQYHTWRWQRVIRNTYGHKPIYLAATGGAGQIVGILPLFLIRSAIFGRSLVSVPFSSYGGMLCDSPDASDVLGADAVRIAHEIGAKHVELRGGRMPGPVWTDLTRKVTMIVDLPDDLEQLWTSLNPKVRKRIRHANKSGITTACSGGEGIAEFYPIFADNMRNLGTPVYPRNWFENIERENAGSVHVVTVYADGKPSGSAFLLTYRDTVEMPWAATLVPGRKRFTPLVMYWSVIEWAHRNGFRKVDLGRCTPGSGNYEFKQHWRPVERPLEWFYWTRKPSADIGPHREDSRFSLAVNVWKHLPLAVANTLGPRIVRSIP